MLKHKLDSIDDVVYNGYRDNKKSSYSNCNSNSSSY